MQQYKPYLTIVSLIVLTFLCFVSAMDVSTAASLGVGVRGKLFSATNAYNRT